MVLFGFLTMSFGISVLNVQFFFYFFFINVRGDYSLHAPHSNWANTSETGLQSVSGAENVNLKIVKRGKRVSWISVEQG